MQSKKKLEQLTTPGQRGYFTVREFAALTGVSVQWLYRGIWQKGNGPNRVRVPGRKSAIDYDEGVRWVSRYLTMRTAKRVRKAHPLPHLEAAA
ncbi:hypothetical protein [Mesorhizobium sp. DCY119]|uniref:helix-turn-helix transcriptional regulator n=1 Tax=Mesorhizobium sp. DCY119 TaxID=2108445 RepID=UPI000E6C0C23|nr:hypothetical protein [Mesorhizobium sp. DCY119]RJG45468.1 hypothetical protein D3Y55_15190 [Mesorhizobium sp. DCY119]